MNAFPDQNLFIAAEPLAAHLTPDQIDDHLIGDLAPAPAAHLAACTLCTERVAAAASPIANFQQVSTAWSERRSATFPIPVPTLQRTVWQRHMAWATASLSLAFGLAFINATHQFSFAATQPTPTPAVSAQLAPMPQPGVSPVAFTQTASIAPRAAQSAAQLSADNHLLRAIDASLDPSTDSPATLGLTSAAAISTGPPTSVQD
jgi:hypothetical protein